ncbi:NADPH-adrenodoxin reductase [Rhodotorula kratochvilovae]
MHRAPVRAVARPAARAAAPPRPAARRTAATLAGRKMRIGVVGGGPAGFYAASRLLSLPGSEHARVDLFELLPTPFGLARFGVAPDHPEVKNCEHKFEETARDPRFRFFGNVQISGSTPPSSSPSSGPNAHPSALAATIPLDTLREHYDAVLLTYGAALDRPLGIPGEDTLLNVLSARTFVSWYNGHPYHSGALSPLLDLSQLEHATIIGQGNVALDVARILLKPVDALRAYDVPEPVLAALSRSRVKRVDIVGRRGPLHLAATTKELRELLALPGVGFEADPALLAAAAADVDAHPGMDGARAKKRALGLLRKGSATPAADADRSWSLQFLRSPVELLHSGAAAPSGSAGALAPPQSLGAVRYAHNELVPSSSHPSGDPATFSARATASSSVSRTDVLFKSVGYRALPLPGLPFDARRGCVRNDEGRVVDERGERVQGLYTSGWLARGPTGVIATTMFDAFAAADIVASDLASTATAGEEGEKPELPLERLRGAARVVSWEDWEALDRVERERGRELGKLREKITDVREMLDLLP